MLLRINLHLMLVIASISTLYSANDFKLVNPKPGVQWISGEYHAITWTGVSASAQVRLEYSTNGGDHWVKITDSAYNNAHIWKIPSARSTHCLIRAFASADSTLSLVGHQNFINTASFSHDSKMCVTASDDATARVWSTTTGEVLQTLSGHTADVMFADFNNDATRILTLSQDRTAKIWNLANGTVLRTLTGHTAGLVYGGFSPDGELAVTASDDGTARIWDATTGELIRTIYAGYTTSGVSGLYCAFFSPNNQYIITGGRDGSARVYDLNTNSLVLLLSHADVVHWAGWSHDMSRIVTACRDGKAYVWDAKSGAIKGVLAGHTSWVWSAEFSHDDALIVTGGREGTARIWDPTSFQCTKVITASGSDVGAARISPDRTLILTASNDKTAKLFRIAGAKSISAQSDSLFTINDPSLGASEELDNPSLISIAPNPCTNRCTVMNLTQNETVYQLQLVSTTGQIVFDFKSSDMLFGNGFSIDVSKISSGQYTMILSTSGGLRYCPLAVAH